MTKSRTVIATEGALYVIIAAGSPFAEFLISDRVVSQRSIAAVSVVALVAGANALKAFLSQSMSNQPEEPTKVEVVNTEENRVPTEEKETPPPEPQPAPGIERMDRLFQHPPP